MTDLTPEALAALDRKATQGEFYGSGTGHICAHMPGPRGGRRVVLENAAEMADTAFIVALVNLYRAGKLVHVDAPRVATAEMVERVAGLISSEYCQDDMDDARAAVAVVLRAAGMEVEG
jgi:L-aminopeptidase/D-esterase-like protein